MKQNLKRMLCSIVTAAILFGCIGLSVTAADVPSNALPRATGNFNITVKPGVTAKRTTKLSLEAGEEVTIRAVYTPDTASVDVGLIDSNNIFHYEPVEDGVIDITIAVETRGNYTFAIRNNGSVEISVSGYVNY